MRFRILPLAARAVATATAALTAILGLGALGQPAFASHDDPTGGGKYRAGLFAFDEALHPAGSAVLSDGSAGVDRAGGVAIDIDQNNVLLGGSTDPSTTRREDLAGASFPRASFLPEPSTGLGLPIGFGLMLLARRRRAASSMSRPNSWRSCP